MSNQNRSYTISIESKDKSNPFPKNEFQVQGLVTVKELINQFENKFDIKKKQNTECIVNSRTFRGLILDKTIESQLKQTYFDTFVLEYIEQSNYQSQVDKIQKTQPNEKALIKITFSLRQSKIKQTDHFFQINPRITIAELKEQFQIDGADLDLFLSVENQEKALNKLNEPLEDAGVKDGSYIIAKVRYCGGY